MTREEIIRSLACKSELTLEIVERDFGSLSNEVLMNMLKLIKRVEAIGEYNSFILGGPIPTNYLE